jgi:hypothetical protein
LDSVVGEEELYLAKSHSETRRAENDFSRGRVSSGTEEFIVMQDLVFGEDTFIMVIKGKRDREQNVELFTGKEGRRQTNTEGGGPRVFIKNSKLKPKTNKSVQAQAKVI